MTTIIRGARVLTLDAADTEHARADMLIEVVPDLSAPAADGRTIWRSVGLPTGGDG